MLPSTLLRPLMLSALAAFLLWGYGHWRYQQGVAHASQVAELQQQRMAAAQAQAIARQEEQFREQEQRWRRQHDDVEQQTHARLERAQRDADAARRVAVRLQQQITRLAAGAARTADAPDAGPAASNAGVLLAELFRRADERAAALAEYADRARLAGAACQQAWPVHLSGEH